MRRFCLAVFIALLAATGARAQFVKIVPAIMPAAAEDISAIHSVAVISAIGSSLTLRRSDRLFGRDKQLDIAEWKIDDFVISSMHKYLADRFSLKDAAYSTAD